MNLIYLREEKALATDHRVLFTILDLAAATKLVVSAKYIGFKLKGLFSTLNQVPDKFELRRNA